MSQPPVLSSLWVRAPTSWLDFSNRVPAGRKVARIWQTSSPPTKQRTHLAEKRMPTQRLASKTTEKYTLLRDTANRFSTNANLPDKSNTMPPSYCHLGHCFPGHSYTASKRTCTTSPIMEENWTSKRFTKCMRPDRHTGYGPRRKNYSPQKLLPSITQGLTLQELPARVPEQFASTVITPLLVQSTSLGGKDEALGWIAKGPHVALDSHPQSKKAEPKCGAQRGSLPKQT